MGNTRDTGYLRNLVIYDGSGNITLPANLTVTGSIVGYATTSYVTTQINNLINGAPGLLDTLDELAAALGDDANFAATITTSLAGKQSTLTFTGPLVNTSGTITITQSSGSTNGFLSNTDWTTFNSKQSTLTFSGPLVNTSGTISITQSSGSTNGYLSNTDWTTFNNKQAALSGTGFVKISGTTISYDNSTYLTTASATSTYLPLAGGTLTGALAGTSATFSSSVGVNISSAYLLNPLTIGGNQMFMATSADGVTNSVIGRIMSQTRNYGAGIAASSFASIEFVTDGTTYYKGGMRFLVNNVDGTSTSPTTALTLASTGAATFSSSVTAATYNVNSGGVINVNSQNGFQLGADAFSGGFYVYDNTASVYRFKIANGGAATFSSSITSGGGVTASGDITANAGSATAITVYNASSIRAKLSMTGNEGDLTLYGSSANAKVYLSAYYNSYFNAGNVGIGITNPQAILDVSHSAGTTNIIRVSNGAGNYRWRIDQNFTMAMTNASGTDTFSVSTAGAISGSSLSTSGFLKAHGSMKTFVVEKNLDERLSNSNYFRMTSSSGGFQVIVYSFSQNVGVGWSGSQIFQAVSAPYWGGWVGSSANVSQIGGESGVISSAVIGNDGTITFRVNTGNNGTNTQGTIRSYIQVNAFNIDGVTLTAL
jgi:hypothetical protein